MRRVRFRLATPMVAAPLGVSTLLFAAAVAAQGAPPPPPPLPGPPTAGTTTGAPTPTPTPPPPGTATATPPPPPMTPPPTTTAPATAGAGATGTASLDGSTTGLDAEAAGGEEAAEATDDEKREKAMHETATPWGPTGLLHTPSAMTREAGTFSIGFFVDWFKSSSFLCTANYPCTNSPGGGTSTSDNHSHIGAALVLNATLVTGLEAYATGRVYANSNDQGRPNLLQVLGDTTFGLKYVRPLGSGLVNLGGGAEVVFLNGTGGIGLSGAGTSFRLRALSTFALDQLDHPTPLRFHIGLAYYFDNSNKVVSDVEDARSAKTGKREQITRIERYGLGINKVDRFEIGIGAEALLAHDKVRPFLEYTMWLPVNRQSYECPKPADIPGGGRSDECLADPGGFSYLPSKLSVGAKFFPFEGGLRGLAGLLGIDLGITGTSKFISEVAPQAPWTLWVGVALTTDTVEKPPKIVEKSVEKKVEVQVGTQLVHVKGFVHEQGTATPLPNAIVTYVGGVNLPAVATGGDGTFGDDVPAGTYQFNVHVDGYKDGTCGGTATLAPKNGAPPAPPAPPPGSPPGTPPVMATPGVMEVDCAMEPLPKVGSVTLSIVDADNGSGMGNVAVTVTDSAGSNPRSLQSDGSGNVRLEQLAPGTYFAAVDIEGYLSTRQPFEIAVREDRKAQISVRPRPKDKLVEVGKTEIKIKQQVHFATDKATILGDSTGLLEEVADVMIHTPRIKKVEIQGHTDNQGTKEHNLQLSIDRAEAVKKFLVDHGVDASRVETHGFGDTKPISPNINEAGRAKNRRVQFVIVDQDPGEPEKKEKKPKPKAP